MICSLVDFLEIEVTDAITHEETNGKRYTDYLVRMKTNLPKFTGSNNVGYVNIVGSGYITFL